MAWLYPCGACTRVVVLGVCCPQGRRHFCLGEAPCQGEWGGLKAEPRPAELTEGSAIRWCCLCLDETMEKGTPQDVPLRHESLAHSLLTDKAQGCEHQT